MSKNISENIKEEVLKTYMYTKRPIKSIAKEYNLLYEDVIYILEDYRSIHGDIPRNLKDPNEEENLRNLKESKEEADSRNDNQEMNEKIYRLREQRLSYDAIEKELRKQGITISVSTIRRICKEMYKSKGVTIPKAKRAIQESKYNQETYEEIYKLREQKLSYRDITERLKQKGIKINIEIVRKTCKEIYKLKGITIPNAKKTTQESKYSKEIDEEIYKLREQRLTYRDIAERLEQKGINISFETVRKKCKELYALQEKSEPKLLKKEIDNEEIYKLRQQSLSYREIVEELGKQGIKISSDTVRKICKEIYSLKGEDEPRVRRGGKAKSVAWDDNSEVNQKIYELREESLSYREIAEELEKQGIKICFLTVRRICKEIYSLKEEDEPRVRRGGKAKSVAWDDNSEVNQKIYELREQSLSYREIAEELKKLNVNITYQTISNICKEIYSSRGEIEPKAKRKKIVEPYRRITGDASQKLNETIYNLKEQGLSYKKIREELIKNNINITREAVQDRLKRFLKANEEQLAKAILNLTITRKATIEQIQQIADYYGVDLERTLNSLEEQTHSLEER